jgi:hypothetical protein
MAMNAKTQRSILMIRKRSLILLLSFFVAFAACGTIPVAEQPYEPIFTEPQIKIAATAAQVFTTELLTEATAYEPALLQPSTQVHMGFWSGPGNHGSLVRLMDAINSTTQQEGQPLERAIWDEGATSSLQYPAYVTMLEEHWYDRTNEPSGLVTIYGTLYRDPFPVTFEQADAVWGQYSQRYTDMAAPFFETTGRPVKAWCFVEGAHANRIFYTYELPELAQLEAAGAVQVFFAKTQDADWQNPDDWIQGTTDAPIPAADISPDLVTLENAF